MKIYNSDPAAALWELLAPVADDIPVYKEIMDEDANGMPESYLLIRTEISDGERFYGDGQTQLRTADCDLLLVSKSKGAASTDIHNRNKRKIKALLDSAGISYTGYNLGYNDALKSSEYSWSLSVIYG